MKLKRFAAGASVVLALAAAPLGSFLASPAGAAPKTGQVEHCAGGLVVVHTDGQSVWAESGDAKWQLVAITGTASGTFFDKKTDQLIPFGPFPIDKTWAKGNQTIDQTCTGSSSSTDPDTGAQFNLRFVASLRQVQ